MTEQFDFNAVIDRKGTYCTQWDYVQDRFGKAELLPFTISDMDLAVPNVVMEALEKRMAHPVFGYSRWNHDDYKDAISFWFESRFACNIDKDSIVYGPSVIYIISKLIEQWSSVGDGVVYQTPAYDAFEKMIKGSNRKLAPTVLVQTESGWEIDWLALETQLAKPENRIFLLCSPHNPTGRVWRRDELIQIATLCQKHQVKVISDEIHMDVSFKPHTPWQSIGDEKNWALVTSGSKSFNIPALTGAYALIPDHDVRENYLFKLKEVDGLSSPAILAVIATIAAYRNAAPWLDALNQHVLAHHAMVQSTLKAAFPEMNYQIPDATYLAWVDLRPLQLDMQQLQKDLVEKFDVAIMDGAVYGEAGRGYLRLNLGCATAKVEAGLTALIGAIQLQK